MAKHILDGENFLYFYGQSYMGSLDAYLVALGFLLFGEQVWVIRLIQLILYGLVIIFSYLFVNISFQNKKIAFVSSLFLVFPAVNVVLYTTVSLGGYGEAMLLGVVSFYVAAFIVKGIEIYKKINHVYLGILGFLLGIGLFVNPISLTMIIPAIVFVAWKIVKSNKSKKKIFVQFLFLLIFFLLGSALFWYSLILTNGLSVIREIGGSAVAVESESYFQLIKSHAISLILFGPTVILGLRPPWGVNLIGIVFIPFVILYWIFTIYLLGKEKYKFKDAPIFVALTGVIILVAGGFIFTSFGIDPSGRYFLPIVFPLSVFFGYAFIKLNNKVIYALGIITLVFHLYGAWKSGTEEPYMTTQFYSPAQVDHSRINELQKFLIHEEEYYGFSNYWISYPLAFVSDEKIISIPKLPYHQDLRFTERDNRISKYNEILEMGSSYFYITSNNPKLDDLLVRAFQENYIDYLQKQIDDYHVFYNLSKKITPEELGITNEFN
ncbi:MAG: glycosyltransferase family 39 protein [Anaerolineaceae bacterium]|nr:glycosyltransferase family 39 protein [Anaerolineaceae bacterium]